jgi:NADH-quinone oxidoreductase subunit J
MVISFIILAALLIIGSITVITLPQPVHAALALVGTLLTLAVIYATLQAHFLAVVQVIVYAGAIMVLFLFVIMLLNLQARESAEEFRWLRPAAYAIALLAAAAIVVGIFMNPRELPSIQAINAALQGGGAGQIGEVLFGPFVLAFQLVGVLLLTGIVGAVGLVQREQRPEGLSEVALEPTAMPPVVAPGTDDLTRIKGVGPKLANFLQANGVDTFERLATLSDAEVATLGEKLPEFKGRIQREGWLEQARRFARERRV